jgi:hypothetical protein
VDCGDTASVPAGVGRIALACIVHRLVCRTPRLAPAPRSGAPGEISATCSSSHPPVRDPNQPPTPPGAQACAINRPRLSCGGRHAIRRNLPGDRGAPSCVGEQCGLLRSGSHRSAEAAFDVLLSLFALDAQVRHRADPEPGLWDLLLAVLADPEPAQSDLRERRTDLVKVAELPVA